MDYPWFTFIFVVCVLLLLIIFTTLSDWIIGEIHAGFDCTLTKHTYNFEIIHLDNLLNLSRHGSRDIVLKWLEDQIQSQ